MVRRQGKALVWTTQSHLAQRTRIIWSSRLCTAALFSRATCALQIASSNDLEAPSKSPCFRSARTCRVKSFTSSGGPPSLEKCSLFLEMCFRPSLVVLVGGPCWWSLLVVLVGVSVVGVITKPWWHEDLSLCYQVSGTETLVSVPDRD